MNIIAPMAAKWRNRLLLNKSSVPTIALSILAQGAEEQGNGGAREQGCWGAGERGCAGAGEGGTTEALRKMISLSH